MTGQRLGGMFDSQVVAERLVGTVCLDDKLRPGLVTKTDGQVWAGIVLDWNQAPGERWLTQRPVPVANSLAVYARHGDDELGLAALWQQRLDILKAGGGICRNCTPHRQPMTRVITDAGTRVHCLACGGTTVEYWGQITKGRKA